MNKKKIEKFANYFSDIFSFRFLVCSYNRKQ